MEDNEQEIKTASQEMAAILEKTCLDEKQQLYAVLMVAGFLIVKHRVKFQSAIDALRSITKQYRSQLK